MQKSEKEQVVAELAERLRSAESLIVADYRGLTNSQLETLRGRLREHGARFSVVKNTLTRRAAEEAGSEQLLALLEGPTGIAFVEAEGDTVAVAKALADTAKDTKILTLRGGIMAGRAITDADLEELAKLPPVDVLKGQLVGVILAPLNQLAGLLRAPLQDLYGLVDARIEQLGGADAAPPAEGDAPEEAAAAGAEAEAAAPAEPEAEPEAELETEPQTEADAPEAGAEDDGSSDAPAEAAGDDTTETTD